jgi:hypothetical protein
MALLDDVVEVRNLAYQNGSCHGVVDLINRRHVGAAFVHRDTFRNFTRAHGLLKKLVHGGRVTLCYQKEIDGLPFVADGAVEILPEALDLDVSVVHAPTDANLTLVFA